MIRLEKINVEIRRIDFVIVYFACRSFIYIDCDAAPAMCEEMANSSAKTLE